jgi:hypothetical protein
VDEKQAQLAFVRAVDWFLRAYGKGSVVLPIEAMQWKTRERAKTSS